MIKETQDLVESKQQDNDGNEAKFHQKISFWAREHLKRGDGPILQRILEVLDVLRRLGTKRTEKVSIYKDDTLLPIRDLGENGAISVGDDQTDSAQKADIDFNDFFARYYYGDNKKETIEVHQRKVTAEETLINASTVERLVSSFVDSARKIPKVKSYWNRELKPENSIDDDLLKVQKSVVERVIHQPEILSQLDLEVDEEEKQRLVAQLNNSLELDLTLDNLCAPLSVEQLFVHEEGQRELPQANNLLTFLINAKAEYLSTIYLGVRVEEAKSVIREHLPEMSCQTPVVALPLSGAGFTSGTIDVQKDSEEKDTILLQMKLSDSNVPSIVVANVPELADKMFASSRSPLPIYVKSEFASYVDTDVFDMMAILHELIHAKVYELVGLDVLQTFSDEQKQENKFSLAGALHEGFALYCELTIVAKMMDKASAAGDRALASQLSFYTKQRQSEVEGLNPYYKDGFTMVQEIMEGKDLSEVANLVALINWEKAYSARMGSTEYSLAVNNPQQIISE